MDGHPDVQRVETRVSTNTPPEFYRYNSKGLQVKVRKPVGNSPEQQR